MVVVFEMGNANIEIWIVDASNSINGSLTISAGEYYDIFQNGLVKCSPFGICDITCSHGRSCYKLQVIGSYGSILTLNAWCSVMVSCNIYFLFLAPSWRIIGISIVFCVYNNILRHME